MAEGRRRPSKTGTIIVGVHDCKQRCQEHFNYEDTIDVVLESFARQLKVEAGSISLLHQGSRLDRRATVQVWTPGPGGAERDGAGWGGAGRGRVRWCGGFRDPSCTTVNRISVHACVGLSVYRTASSIQAKPPTCTLSLKRDAPH